MPVMLLHTYDKGQYPWGWMVRFELTDGTTIYHAESTFPSQPDAAQIAAAADRAIAAQEAALIPPEPVYTYTVVCEDGTEVLV